MNFCTWYLLLLLVILKSITKEIKVNPLLKSLMSFYNWISLLETVKKRSSTSGSILWTTRDSNTNTIMRKNMKTRRWWLGLYTHMIVRLGTTTWLRECSKSNTQMLIKLWKSDRRRIIIMKRAFFTDYTIE